MLVTCALKRGNGTRTKRNVQGHSKCHFYIYLQIGIYIWPCSAITKFALSERY